MNGRTIAKYRSKVTGTIFNAVDSFSSQSSYKIALFLETDDMNTARPRAYLDYYEFTESFEKVAE